MNYYIILLTSKIDAIEVQTLEVVQGSKTRYLFHAAPTNDAL